MGGLRTFDEYLVLICIGLEILVLEALARRNARKHIGRYDACT